MKFSHHKPSIEEFFAFHQGRFKQFQVHAAKENATGNFDLSCITG